MMKAASSAAIKTELKEKTPAQLIDIALRLARFKKENKELLSFLLFHADDLEGYIGEVKQQMDENWEQVNKTSKYFMLKGVRKVLRITNRYIRYTASKTAEVELLMYFCRLLKDSGIKIHKSTALTNIYQAQLKKIFAALSTLHEDLQHDYVRQLDALEQ